MIGEAAIRLRLGTVGSPLDEQGRRVFAAEEVRTARWDRFSHPDRLPEYGAPAFPTVWWWDATKAAKTRSRQ